MEPFAEYMFRSIVWLTGFAIIYFLFLRNERFFSVKRYFLIAGILISLIFPLITFHYQVEAPAPVINTADFSQSGIPVNTGIQQDNPVKTFDYRIILFFLYLTGVILLFLRMLLHIWRLNKTISKTDVSDHGSVKVIRDPGLSSSFSFFNYIFINPSVSETEAGEIMNHELVHVKQKHWFDLLLVEMLRMVQWINPFAWLYTGFIKLNHEFLADEMALQQTSNPALYRAALVNQLFSSPVISFSNSFNYSLNKKRFDMMKKIITSPYRKLKILFVLPVFAIVFYAFATPEYHNTTPADNTLTIYQAPPIIQKGVVGIVLKEDGKPMEGVRIMSTGILGQAQSATTGPDGRFKIENVQEDASLLFFCNGYKSQTLKPDFKKEMKVIMLADTDYKEPVSTNNNVESERKPKLLIVLDGTPTDQSLSVIYSKLGAEMGTSIHLDAKKAIEKYGEAGKYGAVEIYSRKKAKELGLKVPFRREGPDDYPTFKRGNINTFTDWVIKQVKYPSEAATKGIGGRVSVSIIIEADGSVGKVEALGAANSILKEAVIKTIQTSPKWNPAKNPEAREPYSAYVNVKFTLPDKVTHDDAFVIVEKMPQYPGGDAELLKFITENAHYPDSAKANGIQGRVIVRFIVNSKGAVEDAMVLKGVHPLLNAEAIRVISILPKFTPGYQGGKPVSVYYMAPVTFTLPSEKAPN